jgi:hypothetical protein
MKGADMLKEAVYMTVGFSIDAELNSIRLFKTEQEAREYANGDYSTEGCYPMLFGLGVYRIEPGQGPEYCPEPDVA